MRIFHTNYGTLIGHAAGKNRTAMLTYEAEKYNVQFFLQRVLSKSMLGIPTI